MPLSVLQIEQLHQLEDEYHGGSAQYGDEEKKENGEEACDRAKVPYQRRNNISRNKHPKFLKLYHIKWMLHNNREIPKGKELSHLCLQLNLKKKDDDRKRVRGGKCFVPTHVEPDTQAGNRSHDACHKEIKKFYLNNKDNPSVRTRGTIYLKDTDSDLECKHDPPCFGNFGEIKK